MNTPITVRPSASLVAKVASCSSPPRVKPIVTSSPGSTSCSRSRSSGRSTTVVPSTEVTTSPAASCPCAREPSVKPSTVSVVGTWTPISFIAATVACSWEVTISWELRSSTSSSESVGREHLVDRTHRDAGVGPARAGRPTRCCATPGRR